MDKSWMEAPRNTHQYRDDFHLSRHGIDQNYTNWTKHGEKETPTSNVVSEKKNSRDTSLFLDSIDFAKGILIDSLETLEMVEAT
uniref:Uncharacterized protein n=1 Tax=Lactuca sativa TaxID=4236 RepID=A0A9R1X693_LACSA|nr:hypothetical protein LSAT_V11C600329880 [Lactuca sativa]